jgi:glucan phosphoethanolaminetransferase (alkaline phosphatase superfamily)
MAAADIPDGSRAHPALGFVVELTFWFLPTILFLLDYIFYWHRPAGSAIDLLFVFEVALAVVLARTVLLRRCPTRWARLLASAVAAFFLFAALAYYILVHILLGVWARVMTIEVFLTYLEQADYLCDAVGIPFPLAVLLLLASYALCWVLAYRCLTRHAWMRFPARPRLATDLLLLALALYAGDQARRYTYERTTVAAPLRLTLWTGKPGGVRRYFSQGQAIPAQLIEAERRETAAYRPAAAGPHPNLILIVVDGLRYDHLAVNGYARPTTPFLSGLAREGKLGIFTDIHAACGETTCALSSLSASRNSHDMPPTPLTLTKILKRNGYRVQMIMGAYHPDPEALYGKVDAFVDGTTIKDRYLADDRWVLERSAALAGPDARPQMLQYHLMAAHTLALHDPRYLVYQPAARYTGKTSGEPDERHTNYYDNGVVQADAQIGQLLDGLRAKGYLRDAVVAITGDHGETLGEHHKFAHANSVHEQLLHIPFMLLHYRDGVAQGARVDTRPGSQIDIAPTLLQELGLPAPATWTGAPLPLARPRAFAYFQMVPYLGLYDRRDAAHVWKFYTNVYNGEEFAFDLLPDPQERQNRIRQVPAPLLAAWRARLLAIDRSAQWQAGALD